MFHSTRLKLTAWYLLLIMLISFIFSVVIFVDVNRELVRFEHYQELRQTRIREQFGEEQVPAETNPFDEQLVYEARSRLIASLIVLNICILAGAGVAGYFLAGRTLDPIKRAVEDQARFIGDASHELKTPIFNIQGYILTLLDGGMDDPSINKEYLLRTEKSINRMINIVQDLETISHLVTGELKLKLTRFDIVSLVKEVFEFHFLDSFEKPSFHKKIRLCSHPKAEPCQKEWLNQPYLKTIFPGHLSN